MPDMATIRALAPDDASLKAGSGLANPAGWPSLGRESNGTLIWGECSGSGKTPYKVVVDVSDNWTRCSCPSRKFPCKHALGLMMIDTSRPDSLLAVSPVEWVLEWTSKRRSSAKGELETPVDEKTSEKRRANADKRSVKTLDAMSEAITFLEGWISDRLRAGLGEILDDPRRHLSLVKARLVDGKAGSLAEHIASIADRMPQDGSAGRSLVRELGKTVLLVEAWRRSPDDPAIAGLVGSGTTVATARSDKDARIESLAMTCVGNRSRLSSDGRLVRNDTWFVTHGSSVAPFASVCEWGPKSRMARSAAAVGSTVSAEILWHPSRSPCRISVLSGPDVVEPRDLPQFGGLSEHYARLDAEPWLGEGPVGFCRGRFGLSTTGMVWFVPDDGQGVEVTIPDTMRHWIGGIDAERLVGVWESRKLDVLLIESPDLGRIHL